MLDQYEEEEVLYTYLRYLVIVHTTTTILHYVLHLLSYVSICIHLQEDDGGQYRCTARNEAGEVSLTMNLDIASPISVGKYSK